jgi:hypothetical protein
MLGISRRGADFIMGMVSLLVSVTFAQFGGSMECTQKQVHNQIPRRIDEVLKRFDLEGRSTTYAMCPSCHNGHAPEFKPGSAMPIYPRHCVNVILDHGVCNEILLDDHGPIKPFVYHHINDFIGGLMSEVETESEIDQACDDMFASITSQKPPPAFVHDVFDAHFMRTFEGPEDGKLFVDRGTEARLAFSLNVDFFNAEGLRLRGAAASCGIIGLALLNLPSTKRYRPEYMALCGIIPGPRQPHGSQLNHYLAPLIADLKASWEKGVFYRRTAKYPNGRVTHSAVVCEVCDLPGARKLSGLSSETSNHFCSICDLTGMKRNVGRHDIETWRKRKVKEIRQHAERWRDAPTMKEQQKLYDRHGVAWSELYNLPYYDPTRQLTVDAMHCVLEGLVSFHFRRVLKLTSADANSKPVPPPAFTHFFRKPLDLNDPDRVSEPYWKQLNEKEIHDLDLIHRQLTWPIGDSYEISSMDVLSKRLQSRLKKPLVFVHQNLGLGVLSDMERMSKTKSSLVEDICAWVCQDFLLVSTCI